MCTVTLEYNQGNTLARHKLADLLPTQGGGAALFLFGRFAQNYKKILFKII
jgi:hypothetical protein